MARLRSLSSLTAVGVLAALAGPVPPAEAATRVVSNCNDSGAGSLRSAVAGALSGDDIDMTGLTCGRIQLTGGTITLPQNDIVLLGPGRMELTVDGTNRGRVFRHTGTGTLRIYRLSVSNGRFVDVSALGGCIFSAGNVELLRSRVHRCQAIPAGGLEPSAAGGGIFTGGRVLLSESSVFYSNGGGGPGGGVLGGDVTLYRSQVYNNQAGDGGGVYSTRSLNLTYSLIHNNRAGRGGGLVIEGLRAVINKSTISNNSSSGFGGGIEGGTEEGVWIINSTVSGNSGYFAGGAWFRPLVYIVGSTFAFNESTRTDECSPAVHMSRDSLLVSSIVARNTCRSFAPIDLDVSPGFGALSGGHNLIGVAEGEVPGDTLFADPRLGPLANNGGPTRTHLPASDSPVINRGTNLRAQQYDQRGPGFLRVKGGIPDIGAVER